MGTNRTSWITTLRSILFDLSFYLATTVIALFSLPLLMLPAPYAHGVLRLWARSTTTLHRLILGLHYEVKGDVPQGACIIACKHQSAWETVVFFDVLHQPSIILKQELSWIPVVNLYMFRLGFVILNRKAGARSMKLLLEQARRMREEGRPLIIFPEGTRTMPGQTGHYQPGIAALYKDLNIPVVPVALNSGLFWGRRSLIKRPGLITLSFLPPIQPGLSRQAFMEELSSRIEGESQRLYTPETTSP
jgi:1-acyl-sn-glycerol-3-phosphate acyltransferase